MGDGAFLWSFFFFVLLFVSSAAATGASEGGTDRKSGHDGESKCEFDHRDYNMLPTFPLSNGDCEKSVNFFKLRLMRAQQLAEWQKTAWVVLGGICLLMGAASAWAQDLKTALTPAQLQQIEGKETVITSRDLPKEPWPELQLYRKIDAPPEVVKALLLDYDSAPSYTPGMIAAEVIGAPAADSKDVRYTVRMPVVSKISYVVRNTYESKGKKFAVRWTLLESPVASASRGALELEPHGSGTLLRYTNHVTPSVPMAGVLKNQALKEARTTIEAIGAEAERRAFSSASS